MKKKIALLVYPAFSLQEIANLLRLFRWQYDTITDIIYTEKITVKSEEGITVMPDKTCDEFSPIDYDCLILSGCSDIRMALRNQKLKDFLSTFKDNSDFIIAAICSAPLFLAQAGLLHEKKYTDSLFVEMRNFFYFVEEENFLPLPVVEDGNIITANGSAFNDFAVHLAKKLGYECQSPIFPGYINSWKKDDYLHHLSNESQEDFLKEFKDFKCKQE